jgi:tyrosine-protein kinase Etk/Wzc
MLESEYKSQYSQEQTSLEKQLDIPLLLISIRKSLLWGLLFIGLAFVLSQFFLHFTRPVYESSAIIQLNHENSAVKILGIEQMQGQDEVSRDIEIIKSKLFLKQALSKLPLEVSYFNRDNFILTEKYLSAPYSAEIKEYNPLIEGVPIYIDFKENGLIKIKYQLEEELYTASGEEGSLIELPHLKATIFIKDFKEILNKKDQRFFQITSLENIIASYAKKIDVKLLNASAKTIEVSLIDYNPNKSQDIVNTIATEFLNYEVERKSESTKNLLLFIDSQIEGVYYKLAESEKSMSSFKTENMISKDMDFLNVEIEKFGKIEERVIDLEMEESVYKEIFKRINESNKEIDIYNITPILSGIKHESSITNLINKLQKLLLLKEEAAYSNTSSSENIKALDHHINIQKKLINESLIDVLKKISVSKESLTRKAAEVEKSFKKAPSKELEYASLHRNFAINEKYYNMLMEKRTEFSIMQASFVPQNLILDMAQLPLEPLYPSKKNIIFYFILGGIFLTAAMVALRYLLNNEINTLAEITSLSKNAPAILGIIPKYKNEFTSSQIVVDKNPKSFIAESFRSVRANFKLISEIPKSKVISVSSTISEEGKTFTVLNLASVISFSGKKVIIIDLDMRKPKIHLGFKNDNSKGMSTILSGKHLVEDCIYQSHIDNLDFITSGPVPSNPSELILSAKMDEIIQKLKTIYQVVIIDTPPVGLVADAIAIFQKSDYPIYVFRAARSKRNFIKNLDKLIEQNNIKNISVILNGVDFEKNKFAYKHFGDGYEYGYGSYGSDNLYLEGENEEQQPNRIASFVKKMRLW